MKILGNIIWVLFGGFFIALEYFVSSIGLFITIIGIPFGIQTLKLGVLALWPFGSQVVDIPQSSGCLSFLMNVIWFILPGWLLALGHLITAAFQAITIIGIPLAIANIKMIPITCFPFGKDVMTRREAEARRRQVLVAGPA